MTWHGEIVEISRIEAEELLVEWRVRDVLSLLTEHDYNSSEFSFGGVEWCLTLCPNWTNETRRFSSGWLELSVKKCHGGRSKTFKFLVGIRGSRRLEKKRRVEMEMYGIYRYDWKNFCSRSELIKHRNRLMPGDVLAIACIIKMPCSARALSDMEKRLTVSCNIEEDSSEKNNDKASKREKNKKTLSDRMKRLTVSCNADYDSSEENNDKALKCKKNKKTLSDMEKRLAVSCNGEEDSNEEKNNKASKQKKNKKTVSDMEARLTVSCNGEEDSNEGKNNKASKHKKNKKTLSDMEKRLTVSCNVEEDSSEENNDKASKREKNEKNMTKRLNVSCNDEDSSEENNDKASKRKKKKKTLSDRMKRLTVSCNGEDDSSEENNDKVLKHIKNKENMTKRLNVSCNDGEDSSEENNDKASKCEKNKKNSDKPLQDFTKLFTSGENSDVIIKVGDVEFKVHSLILYARSPALSVLLQHETTEKALNRIIIEDCEPDIFRDFLLFLYSGSVLITEKNVFSLYRVADKYLADNLKLQCLEHIRDALSVQTFCDTVKLALAHGESCLYNQAMAFAAKNIQSIICSIEWQNFNHEHRMRTWITVRQLMCGSFQDTPRHCFEHILLDFEQTSQVSKCEQTNVRNKTSIQHIGEASKLSLDVPSATGQFDVSLLVTSKFRHIRNTSLSQVKPMDTSTFHRLLCERLSNLIDSTHLSSTGTSVRHLGAASELSLDVPPATSRFDIAPADPSTFHLRRLQYHNIGESKVTPTNISTFHRLLCERLSNLIDSENKNI